MWTIVAITATDGGIQLECYGPFGSYELASNQAESIQYPCQILIEYLWGNVDIDKPKAQLRSVPR